MITDVSQTKEKLIVETKISLINIFIQRKNGELLFDIDLCGYDN